MQEAMEVCNAESTTSLVGAVSEWHVIVRVGHTGHAGEGAGKAALAG